MLRWQRLNDILNLLGRRGTLKFAINVFVRLRDGHDVEPNLAEHEDRHAKKWMAPPG